MVKDLKDLEKILKLCRKQGVTEIEVGGLKLKLGDLPQRQSTRQDQTQDDNDEIADPFANFPDGILTPEQLAYYSAGGVPEDDPENKEGMQQ